MGKLLTMQTPMVPDDSSSLLTPNPRAVNINNEAMEENKPLILDEFEDLKVVAGKEFEYEYPTKKVDEPVSQAD